ncbi:MAG TPA: hypothetical protein VFL66_03160 [Gaiellaceae bacterium]|nr:hypothetical protein [Gaiellaceae bacterium]
MKPSISDGRKSASAGAAERGESLPETGVLVPPAAAERVCRVERAAGEVSAHWQFGQGAAGLVGVEALPDAGERTGRPQSGCSRREDRPAPFAELETELAEVVEASPAGDDDEDAARAGVLVELAFGRAVTVQLLVEPLQGLGAAVPLQQQVDRTSRRSEDQLGVGT